MLLCQCCYCDYDIMDLFGCVELSGEVVIGDLMYYILIGVDVYDYEYDQLMMCWCIVWGVGDIIYLVDLLDFQYGQV